MDERTLCFIIIVIRLNDTYLHFLGYTHTKVTTSILIDIHIIIAFSEPLTTTNPPSKISC